MGQSGPVYLLPTGPISSFLVISDPACAKHILRSYPKYGKGLVREVAEFLFGDGFAICEGDLWKGRRRAVVPSLHKAYLEAMVERVFGPCTARLEAKLAGAAAAGRSLDMEAAFSQLTLDIIGKAVFNYDYNALSADSPVIQAVYTALKETEQRATDLLPIWKVPLLAWLDPRQRKAQAAVAVIRQTTEQLISQCRAIVERENDYASLDSEYVNESDPSVLRFLLASRVEVSETQLRDDLLSMLVAGHETTGSVLTWTLKLLVEHPEAMARAQAEADAVLGPAGGGAVTLAQSQGLAYTLRCINESMRLYPHPPVLIRRASEADSLPGGYDVPAGQDILISVYNIHRSPAVWDRPDDFLPERFPLDEPVPTEVTTDYRRAAPPPVRFGTRQSHARRGPRLPPVRRRSRGRYIPFSGGPRKCVGDQFALLEAVTALASLLRRFDFALVPGQDVGMTTGATIHTQNGLYMTVKERAAAPRAPAMAR